ncbi:MAG: hypothetical protein IT495_11720 [Gammaproteobacteria bacterium]|nr:hypothetical protein [Gammaproteobacteria bacterium]
MLIVDPKDDLFHRTPLLHKVTLEWREHMYINVYDRNLGFAAVHHFQFVPGAQKAFFNCVYLRGDTMERYSNLSKIPADLEGMRKMSDGKLTINMIEPKKKIHLAYEGERFKSDLHYEGRFEVFDYKQCPLAGESPLGDLGRMPLNYNHIVQGLTVSGTVDIDGTRLEIDGIANRDHSWGLRNEIVQKWHHWTGINFENRFINFCAIEDITAEPSRKHGGGICDKDGNIAIVRIDFHEEPKGEEVPDRIYYELQDVNGKVHKLVFHAGEALGPVWFPNRPIEPGLVYEMLDLWGKWEDEITGQIGWGLDEMGKMKPEGNAKQSYAK